MKIIAFGASNSSDHENAGGIPDLAKNFREKLSGADALIISFAEHNGSYFFSSCFNNRLAALALRRV